MRFQGQNETEMEMVLHILTYFILQRQHYFENL